MKVIFESALDFKQLQNLMILIFCFVMILFGMLNSLKLTEYTFIKVVLLVITLSLLFFLFIKKGLYLEQNKVYTSIFLFGLIIRKTDVYVEQYNSFFMVRGNLSTNYPYSKDVKSLRNWEPDLNVSVKCFSLVLANENVASRKKIITLTKLENANSAIRFIADNTNLKFIFFDN